MLKDKVIIVTGAGSGIGRAASIIFARAGAKVLATDYNEAAVQETAALVGKAGGTAKAMQVDVSKEADVIAMVDFAVKSFGRLDGAFNNAGVPMHGKRVDELSEGEWDRVLDINLKGVFFCMKYETLAMSKSGGGAIVNTASANGLVGNPNSVEYIASKHGVVGITRGAACDAAVTKVRVNAVLPGVIKTAMVNDLLVNPEMKDFFDTTLARHTVGRLGEPEDIGYAAKWLLSDEASFMNGAAVCVDGGYTAR
ncbi:MAG: glucose 1-dehydrogenase [Rhodocyclaceae bacterium]|nr:glucose 1-dehydrogenase [Rhodocyclaceae bacterium]